MFGLRKKGPIRPFTHADNCKIMKAESHRQIKSSEVETGHWRAVCQCGSEDVHEEPADRRVQLDRSMRRPAATRGSASSPPIPMPLRSRSS